MRMCEVQTLIVVALGLACSGPPAAMGWGDEGHRIVNRAAVAKLPGDMPPFFRQAVSRLVFLGPEPDRWRDSRQLYSALREANGPDHFIDIDNPEEFRALPDDRYKYAKWLIARGQDPKEVGFLPYACLEGFERVQVLFRLWRDPQQVGDREQIVQNIIYYAGILGHYVADGANPLHTTVHYNGWTTSWNPEFYTREPLHRRFETDFVTSQIQLEDVTAQSPQMAQRLRDPFAGIMEYLLDSHSYVNELYKRENIARWDGNNRNAESKKFVAARLAAAAQMLASLWYTAWLDSPIAARAR